jgi:hypothetical protein
MYWQALTAVAVPVVFLTFEFAPVADEAVQSTSAALAACTAMSDEATTIALTNLL